MGIRRLFLPKFLLSHYFFLYCIGILLAKLTGKVYVISILIPLLVLFISIFRSKRRSCINYMDILWFILFLWPTVTWLFNDYPYKLNLVFRCIISQMTYMMAYWIGRERRCRAYLERIFSNAKLPVLICCILGLWWFFMPPGWYMREIESAVEGGAIQSIAELSRLKSIFTSPYDLAYFNTFMLIFLFQAILLKRERSVLNITLIPFIVLCLLFGMMRAPMAGSLVGLFVIYTCLCLRKKKIFLIVVPFSVLILFLTLFQIASSYIDADIYDFLLYKFDMVSDDSYGFLEERFNIYDADMALFGDGVGRHAFYADDYVSGSSMRDGEYIKIIVEQGLIGLSFYIIFFAVAFIKCLKHIKFLAMEMSILLFCLISMIGANSLTTSDKHGLLFWLVFGIIASFKRPKRRKNIRREAVPIPDKLQSDSLHVSS